MIEIDAEKIDQAVLALLYLNSFQEGQVIRAWKSLNWDAMDRLHASGYIRDPKSSAKSIVMTDEGMREAEKLCEQLFWYRGLIRVPPDPR